VIPPEAVDLEVAADELRRSAASLRRSVPVVLRRLVADDASEARRSATAAAFDTVAAWLDDVARTRRIAKPSDTRHT
jgi:hypothetical protein